MYTQGTKFKHRYTKQHTLPHVLESTLVLQVRERECIEKDGDLKTLKKLLHESFQAEPASKVCNMSDSKITT